MMYQNRHAINQIMTELVQILMGTRIGVAIPDINHPSSYRLKAFRKYLGKGQGCYAY